MKALCFSFLVLVSVGFGQQISLPEAARYVVPVSLKIGDIQPFEQTGIQVGPNAVIMPAIPVTSITAALPGVLVSVRGKVAQSATDIGNGMVLLSVPGLNPDAPILQLAKFTFGEQKAVICVGYRNGQLFVQDATVVENPLYGFKFFIRNVFNLGVGWGVFSKDGKLVSVIDRYELARNPLGGPQEFIITLGIQSAYPILMAAEPLLAVADK